VTTRPPSREIDYRRLARRNLPSLLTFKFLNEYGYDKGEVVVKAIVTDICDTIRRYYKRKGDLEPGELIYLAPAKGQRAGRGRTIAKTKLLPVRLTIVAQEDIDAVRDGAAAARRREIRVRRLCREAFEQGALLSQRDIALVTGYSEGGVSITAVDLRERGEFLALRGYIEDMGCFPTHKAAIMRLYVQGMLTPDIARVTHHSKEAVDRYIKGFERTRLLATKFAREELPLLTGMPASLVDEYLALIHHHDALPKEVREDAAASS
jgi:hypothetical protein